jgi:hypothetical protein
MWSAWLALAVVLLAAWPAMADDTVVIVSGSAPAHVREVASSAISSATDLAGTKIVPSPFLTHEEAALTKCLADSKAWVCMNPTLRSKNVQQLAVVSLNNQTSADGSPVIVITEQIVTAAQFAPAGDKRFCEHCTDDVLARLTSELTRDLLREVAARSGRTVVAIKTVPRGAQIKLDDKLMGATDQLINTYPGSHTIVLELDGYQTSNRTVDAVEGKTTEVNVALVKPSSPGVPGQLSPVSNTPPADQVTGLAALPHWVPWLGIGAGVAAVGVGVALQVSKDSPPIGQHQPPRLVSTPGVVLMVGGGLVAGAGVLLWVYMASNAAPSSAPTVSVTQGGGVVGWTGRF